MSKQTCPTCGSQVEVITGEEGTSYFAPQEQKPVDIEQWYHKWMADRNKTGIATMNVLDMLKDFAKQFQQEQKPVDLADEVAKKMHKDIKGVEERLQGGK